MEIRLHAQLILLTVGLIFSPCALAGSAEGTIKQFPLDERTVYEVGIAQDVPTTLMFPSALTAIEGANVTNSPETQAPVLLAYTPGQNFFSVRALDAGAKGAVNVVWKQRTFVIRFVESLNPMGSVTFYPEDIVGRGRTLHKQVTSEVLLSLLDRAKAHPLLERQYPEATQQIERATPVNICYYKDFQVTVEEVFRFDPEDTIVFRIKFENQGDTPVYYQPQRLAARVGLNVYYPSIVDCSGVVPPKGFANGFFAITGNPAGGRANLSVKNTFSIVVSRVERDVNLIQPE